MISVKEFLKLIRIEQWYKNIVVFVPLIFSLSLFDKSLFIPTFYGFIALCLVSSSYYIINDIVDLEKDKHHPEKKNRPIASGKIKKIPALFVSLIFLVFSLLIANFLSTYFLYSIIGLFLLTQLYTLSLKKIAFFDIIIISINFAIRAVSGTFIINRPVSNWVLLCTFFISVFLVSGKRSVEIQLENAKEYRTGFNPLDSKVLEFLSIFSAGCVFVFFSIYSIMFQKPGLLLSIPFALYITLMFYRNIYIHPEKIRNPEKFIFDKRTFITISLWLITVIIGFYAI
ncbi:MAG: UbiA prenyltransferase family protein [Candidatus Pacearchaeota archaeon]